ncbi:MAG: winged helix-turn-helix transcriptional regulator [Actinobacteria bacterium]|nr:winged helix-turn-helix transcriptional regulator [Actinomycetota bacterium]MBE3120921.1 winged helix-turn-helix transcriptional regulator [Thermoplasmata archaeon]
MGQNEEKILQIISQNKYVTIAQIASSLKIVTTTVENNLEKLKIKDCYDELSLTKVDIGR